MFRKSYDNDDQETAGNKNIRNHDNCNIRTFNQPSRKTLKKLLKCN